MESIFRINTPVQMISCTDTDGNITPLRFRFKDKSGELITVTISKIKKAEQSANVMQASFTCSAFIFGEEKIFKLMYNYRAHAWKLTEMRE